MTNTTTTTNKFEAMMNKAGANTETKVELTPEQRDEKRVMALVKSIAHTVINERDWINTAMVDLEYKDDVKDIHMNKKRAWRIIEDRKWESKLDAMYGRPLKEVAMELKAMFTLEVKEVAERRTMWEELEKISEDELIEVQKKLGLI